MASIINASTSTGLVTTADTSGVLQLQTGGTTAVSIGTDQSVNFSATGQRITGDFSNATVANRVAFQTSTANGNTGVYFLPNGTATTSNVIVSNASDPTNSALGILGAISSDIRISSAISGTGTYLPLTFYTGGSERVRIDTSGNVGIGTSSISSGLRVNVPYSVDTDGAASKWTARFSDSSAVAINVGGSLLFQGTRSSAGAVGNFAGIAGRKENATDNNEQGYLGFFTTPSTGVITERMRIDSSGNLLVSKTNTSSGVVGSAFLTTGDSYSSMASSSNSQSTLNVYSTTLSQYQFYVGMAGTVYARTTTISGLSDARLKENIRDLDDGLNTVMALKPRKFDWKEGKGADIKNARGFIAQEFETVFPDLIDTWKDPAPEGEEPYKSVRADLIPTLVKAIQEMKAIIDTQASTITSLTDRITALEGTTP